MRISTKLHVDQRGMMNALLIPLILTVILLLGTFGFAIWAFTGMQDYKNNVDEKVKTAVAVAVKEAETRKDNEFQEREKLPLKTYQGPSASGSIIAKYPKTWSAYVEDKGTTAPLDGYFYPTQVPGKNSGTAYALRIEVINRQFSQTVKAYDSQIKRGVASSKPYVPKNVTGVVGLRIDGEIAPKQQGILLLLPLRDKTIKVYTESDQFFNDFNKNILPNFSYTP